MSDESKKTSAAPLIIMKGGTVGTQTEREQAEFMADTRERRRIWQKEREAAAVPVQEGGALLKTMDMGTPATNAVAILYYLESTDTWRAMQCDVTVDPQKAVKILVLVCPRCIERGRPQTMAQISVRDDNRKWHLDRRFAGQVWVDTDGDDPTPYILAGQVTCEERCRCPHTHCDYAFQISPDGPMPGTSRLRRVL